MKKLLFAAAIMTAWGIACVSAQNYPARPITMIAPFPAGGSTDIVARIVADGLKAPLGQTVVVENISGASGTIGSGRVARAEPDGYTLLLGQWSSNVGAGALYTLPYHVLNDFEPIAMVTTSALWIMGRNGLPPKDLKELIGWLKTNPGKATVGTVGAGSAAHVCMVYLEQATGTKVQYVPYRGAAPVMQDLVAEQVDLSCLEAGQALGNYRGGKFKVYAIMGQSRFGPAPEVPTVDEAGTPGLHFPFWHAMWTVKGTPKDVVDRLTAAAVEALADPTVRQKLVELGHEVAPKEQQSPDALRAYHKADIDKWAPMIKAANAAAGTGTPAAPR